MGLGLHQYADKRQKNGDNLMPFISMIIVNGTNSIGPATTTAIASNSNGWSWVVQILPYADENNLFEALRTNSGGRWANGASTAAVSASTEVRIPWAYCPTWTGNGKNGATLNGGQTSDKGQITYRANVGVAQTAGGTLDGVYGGGLAGTETPFAQYRDGTSKTILLLENFAAVPFHQGSNTWTWLVTSSSNTAGTATWTPSAATDCLVIGGNAGVAGGTLAAPTSYPRGASSEHTGGLFGSAMVDGSTRFFSNTTSPATLFSLCTRAGGEPLGEDAQ
jgi:hypothetical protein